MSQKPDFNGLVPLNSAARRKVLQPGYLDHLRESGLIGPPLSDEQKFGHVRNSDGRGRTLPRHPDPLDRPLAARVDPLVRLEDSLSNNNNINFNRQSIALLTEEQKSKYLELASAGMFRATACLEVGVTVGILKATLRHDPAFADRLKTYDRSFVEKVEVVWVSAALGQPTDGDPQVAASYVKFRQEIAAAKQSLTKAARKLDRARAAHERDRSGLGTAALTDKQNDRYVYLTNLLLVRDLTTDEAMEHHRLNAIRLRATGVKSLPSRGQAAVASFDDLFDADE